MDANGRRFRLLVRIGEPTTKPREGTLAAYGWCPVSLEPLVRERGIGGDDQFQALCLTIDFIRMVLKAFVAQGGRVFLLRTAAPIDLDNPSFCSWPDLAELNDRGKRSAKERAEKRRMPNKPLQPRPRTTPRG